MLRFTLLTCLIAFAATSQVFAQQMEDVIHLKNGGLIRGTIIEEVVGKSLKIKTRDGNVFFYTMDEIAEMSRETYDGIAKDIQEPVIGVEIGTLLALRHLRGPEYYSWDGPDRLTVTRVRLPSALSVWLIPTDMMAIGAEIDFASSDTNADVLLTGKVALSPSYTRTSSIYVLGTGSLDYTHRDSYNESDIIAGIGMGLRARMGALVLRTEGRYERGFEDKVNQFSLLLGLGTQLGG